MASSTIEVSEQAKQALARVKLGAESVSETIIRLVGERGQPLRTPQDLERLRAEMAATPVDEAAAAAVEAVIAQRGAPQNCQDPWSEQD